ncbi:MAG TPA: FAD-dependent monooxygenase [Terriglobia bacterium]|nr:FAD-dependent monooxygenase [Terriglobia bacterium]
MGHEGVGVPCAVIGGGPAGAMTAEGLARDGVRVGIFEEKLNWEKPGGGSIDHRRSNQVAREGSFRTEHGIEAGMLIVRISSLWLRGSDVSSRERKASSVVPRRRSSAPANQKSSPRIARWM